MSTQDAAVCRGIPHFTSTTRRKETERKARGCFELSLGGRLSSSRLGDESGYLDVRPCCVQSLLADA